MTTIDSASLANVTGGADDAPAASAPSGFNWRTALLPGSGVAALFQKKLESNLKDPTLCHRGGLFFMKDSWAGRNLCE